MGQVPLGLWDWTQLGLSGIGYNLHGRFASQVILKRTILLTLIRRSSSLYLPGTKTLQLALSVGTHCNTTHIWVPEPTLSYKMFQMMSYTSKQCHLVKEDQPFFAIPDESPVPHEKSTSSLADIRKPMPYLNEPSTPSENIQLVAHSLSPISKNSIFNPKRK